MKNVRVWFTKDGPARYISHLDLNRCMLRSVQKSKIPIWHTEGFNPHPFITFALPLSLGFRGKKEIMDIKLVEDIPYDEIIDKFNCSLPMGIRVFDITEPKMKFKEISYAKFDISIYSKFISNEECYKNLDNLLTMKHINVEKKAKSGLKIIDIKPKIAKYNIKNLGDGIELNCLLAAGNSDNINPNLIFKVFENNYNQRLNLDISRKDLYNTDMKKFL